MSDWHPQVVRIEKVIKHPGADALSIVTTSIGDYPIIIKLDEYKPGDIAAYIPIDSIVPDTAQFHFLSPRRYADYEENGVIVKHPIGPKYEVGNVPETYRRIKAKKIRGSYSQGMLVAMPWESLCPNMPSLKDDAAFQNSLVGHGVEHLFGLFKWEEEEEDNFVPKAKKNHAEQEAPPQGWTIPHYDIDGLRKFAAEIEIGEEVVLTEKIHGANGGFSSDGEKLWVKSRNFYKRGKVTVPIRDAEGVIIDKQVIDSNDQWWAVARRNDLENKLKAYPGLVFFGEVYGQVKGFRYDAEIVDGSLEEKVRFFDIWDTKIMRYLNHDDFHRICTELVLDMAPVLYRGPWLGKEEMYQYAEGKTTLGGKHVREGFVLRTVVERYSERMQGRMQVKLVGEGYNLQK